MTARRFSETCFRWLMRAYPSQFRRTHGLALFELFRDEARAAQSKGGVLALAGLVGMAAWDTARSAPGTWLRHRRSEASRWRPNITGWGSDARVALRQLGRAPGFVLAAAGMLAAGIGANVTVFNLANAVLLRPLARVEPDRVVRVTAHLASGLTTNRFLYAEFVELRSRTDVFVGLAALTQEAFVLAENGVRQEILAEIVSGDYLTVLNAEVVAGRLITPADDRPGADPIVVLSEQLWRRRFNADAGIVGRTLVLNGVSRTVAGVASARFNGSFVAAPVDAWTPLATSSRELGADWQVDRTRRHLLMIGRLAPGVSVDQAQARIQFLTTAFADVEKAILIDRADVIPGTLVFGQQRRLARVFLSLLLGLVVLVLFVVCANVANLMLARLLGRRRELAIRTALGATRGQLVRLLAFESVFLSMLGALGALLLARQTTSVLTAIRPLPTLSLRFDTRLDWRVLAFTVGIAAIAAMVLLIAGAIQVTRPTIRPALADDSGGSIGSGTRNRLRASLVAVQVTVSLLLLVGAALFARSVRQAEAIDLGFDARGVVIADADHIGRTDAAGALDFFTQVLRRLESDPAIQAVAVSTRAPLDSSTPIAHFDATGPIAPSETSARPTASFLVVSPEFFDVIRMPIIEGRRFTNGDAAGAPAAVIVNETLAHRAWPHDSAIGKRLWLDGQAASTPCIVVGVARNGRYLTLGEEGQAHVYLPYAQHPQAGMAVLVRSGERPDRAIARIQDALAATSPTVQGFFPRTLEQHAAVSLLPVRLASQLSLAVAVLGSVLATVGLYALISFLVSERTQELGLRMALGATPGALVALIVRYGMTLAAIGLAVGVPVALASTRLLQSLLYGVSPADPLSFVAVSVVVAFMAIVACAGPALRIVRLDPLTALKRQ
jgi:putative ABC transport system permease protein